MKKEKLNPQVYSGMLLGFVIVGSFLLILFPKIATNMHMGRGAVTFLGFCTASILFWQFYQQRVVAFQLLALGILTLVFFDLTQYLVDNNSIVSTTLIQAELGFRYFSIGNLVFAIFLVIGALKMEKVVDFREIKENLIRNILIAMIVVFVILWTAVYLFPRFSHVILDKFLNPIVFYFLAILIVVIATIKFLTAFNKSKHKIYIWFTAASIMVLFSSISKIIYSTDVTLSEIFTLLFYFFVIFSLFVDNSRFVETEAKLRQDLENSLFETERNIQSYEAILEHANVGFAEIDSGFRCLSFNNKILEILGFKPTEMTSKSLMSMIDSEEKDAWLAAQAKLKQGKDIEIEIALITKSRRKLFCIVNVFPSPGKKGKFHGGNLTIRDISQLKKQRSEMDRKYRQLERTFQEKTSSLNQLDAEFTKSKLFNAALLSGVTEIVLAINNKGKCIYLNEVGRQVSGYKMEELNRNNIPQFLLDLIRVKKDYGQAISVDFRDFEYEWQMKNGKRISCTWNVRFLHDENKKRVGLVGFGLDSSEKKKLEKQILEVTNQTSRKIEKKERDLRKFQLGIDQLFKQSKRLKDEKSIEPFLQSICKIVQGVGFLGAIIYLHEAGSKKFKRKAVSISQSKSSLVNTVDQFINSNLNQSLTNASKICKSYLYEIETNQNQKVKIIISFLKDHDAGWLVSIPSPNQTLEQKIVERLETIATYTHAKIENIKILKKLEAKLNDMEKSGEVKTEFLDYLSHEVRTPLNSVITISDLLLKELPGSLTSEQSKQVDLVKQNADKILHIVNDVLDLSKIKSGNRQLDYSYFSIASVIQSIAAPIRPMCQAKGIKIETKIQSKIPQYIFSDRDKITQSLTNIASNAVKFTDSGKVTISTSLEDKKSKIRFSIQDTGIGIPREKLSNIFQEFSQLKSSSKQKTKGSGLGLSIAKKLVESLGGTISVESKLNKGSEFRIDLPMKKVGDIAVVGLSNRSAMVVKQGQINQRTQKVKSKKTVSVASPQNKNGKIILLVDDDEGSLYATTYFLEEEGFRVVSSRDGNSGIKMAIAKKPDLILMDVVLPDKNGFEAAKQLKSRKSTSPIPIIATTGKATKDDRKKALEAGCVDYMIKPFSLDDLLTRINRWIS